MRNAAALLKFSVMTALLVGCATMDQKFGNDPLYQKTEAATAKAADATKIAAAKAAEEARIASAAAYARTQKYLAEQDLLKTFHDAGEHSEASVLAVLHKSGMNAAGARAKTGAGGKSRAGNTGPGANAGAGSSAGASAGTGAGTGAGAAGGAADAGGKKLPPLPALTTVPEQYTGTLRWPLDAYIVSSDYGSRWGKMHKGLDLAADVGEPVYAIADGEVIYAGDGLRGYGNVVILRHDRKTSSLYAHNSELKVKQGDIVKQGTLIALLGNTGHSTGPHVHFEIRDGDLAVNPHDRLPKSKVAFAAPASSGRAGVE
jgi:murein DD-endopeptidase MepM/ murein hydrolase activator NlpD